MTTTMRRSFRGAWAAALLVSAGALALSCAAPPVERPGAAAIPSEAPQDQREVISPADGPAPSPEAAPTAAPIPLADLRIVVPRLGIDLPLAPGVLDRDVPDGRSPGNTPEHVALLLPGTSVPGTPGNAYIYSHARRGMFLALWSIKLGDAVLVRSANGETFRYAVTQVVTRVDPADVSWLAPDGPERLTLQTSTGPGPADPRFIAVALRSP